MGIIIRKNRNIQEDRKVRRDVKNIDLVHGTTPEQETADVGVYEYSGYHRHTIDSYLNGLTGSPYSRQVDKNTGKVVACGLDFYNRLIQRHEMLIQSTGEPVVLIRRKWTGEVCPCYDKLRGRANPRCPTCFGAGYVGGYVRFINQRHPEGKIYIRLSPNVEDLESQEHGMWQKNVPDCWTLPSPILRDRDVVVRYDPFTGEESWRYEILNVTRNMGLFNLHTAQVFSMNRLDKTHPVYSVREYVDVLNNQVGDLQGSGDELQDVIETNFGDGFNDGGFSLGYFSGYDHGYHDGFYNKDMRGIPDDNRDGIVDTPFGPDDGQSDEAGSGLEYWLFGYREGYHDGYEDGRYNRMRHNPPERHDMEVRSVDIPSDTLGHSDPRVMPPVQIEDDDRSSTTVNLGTGGPGDDPDVGAGTDVPDHGCP